ncbi:MAG: NAD(P)-dependent oxidoreductase [Trueperaceae bacterium]|nr:NAD(P)-dependent oxidoreductase [Trueperaceae bacterium]
MNIGFVGLGTMGAPMAGRLLAAGHAVTVHNRTREREAPLAERGAARAATPAAAAAGADLVITMVNDTPDVRAVAEGEDGVLAGLAPGATWVDASTIAPDAARDLADAAAARGAQALDAPVSGGSEGAKQGTLSIMIGGDAAVLEAVRPALEVLGSTLTHVGPAGAGQIAKAVNQVVIAGTYAAVAEGLALALAADVDEARVLEAISGGAAGSWGLTHRGPNMLAGRYPLGFRTRLHRKDLGIALAAAEALGVPLPLAAQVEQAEVQLIRRGYGDEDVSNVARLAREAAGVDPGSGEA